MTSVHTELFPNWAFVPVAALFAASGFFLVAPVSEWLPAIAFGTLLVVLLVAALVSRRRRSADGKAGEPNFIRFATGSEMTGRERQATAMYPVAFGYIIVCSSTDSWLLAVPAGLLGIGAAWAMFSGAADATREDTVTFRDSAVNK